MTCSDEELCDGSARSSSSSAKYDIAILQQKNEHGKGVKGGLTSRSSRRAQCNQLPLGSGISHLAAVEDSSEGENEFEGVKVAPHAVESKPNSRTNGKKRTHRRIIQDSDDSEEDV